MYSAASNKILNPSMNSAENNSCRLCFTSNADLIDIFNGLDLNVADIVTKYIGEVNRSDALPKYICHNCWQKTEEFHNFYCSVHDAQKEYLKQIVNFKQENELENNPHEITDQPDFVEVITDYDGFDLFTDENVIKSNNEIEDPEYRTDIKPIKVFYHETPISNDFDIHRNEVNDDDSDSESDLVNSKPIATIDPVQAQQLLAQNFDTTCDICFVDLKTLKGAIKHYKREHKNDSGYIKCCGVKLKDDKLIDDHVQWHIDPEIFKCKYCQRCMKTRLSLSTHTANHRHSKTSTCDICGKSFLLFKNLKEHMLRHSRSIKCHLCSKPCSSKKKLEEHLKYNHRSAEVKDQWREFVEAKKIVLNPGDIDRIVSTQFNMNCDKCDSVFKSLQEAQYHYMHEHQIADGYIQCCGMKFKKTEIIEGHVMWHLRPDLFRCCICQRECTTIVAFRKHLQVHEYGSVIKINIEDNTCTVCNKLFTRKHHMRVHMQNIHGMDLQPLRQRKRTLYPDSNSIQSVFDMNCDLCNLELSSLQHAKLHYLEEHNIPDGYIKCCDKQFRQIKQINEHLEYHKDPNIFKCNKCSRTFSKKSDLKAHEAQYRAVETKKFSCNKCGKIFKRKHHLEEHKKTHEEKEAWTFPCDQCNRKFKNDKLRKSHIIRMHETDKEKEEKTEICEFCAKTFCSRKEVLAHIRSLHTDNSIRRESVQCHICNSWLSNRYTLKDHLLRHSAEPQKCTLCDKFSPNHRALLCHMRKVHVERIFECTLCPKTFKEAVSLKDHIATHTGEKMYKCSFCTEAFIWRPNMYSHQKKAHPDEWRKRKEEVPVRRRKLQ